MSLQAIVRFCKVFEDKIAPPLFLIIAGGFFLGLLFLNKDPQATLHLTPQNGSIDSGVLVPVFFMAFWAYSKYTEKNTLAWKLILLAIVLFFGLQFIY